MLYSVLVVAGSSQVFGPFSTLDAANYFVEELPHNFNGQRISRVEVIDMIDIATLGIDPVTGDGTYRWVASLA